jgi:hypothetical protein
MRILNYFVPIQLVLVKNCQGNTAAFDKNFHRRFQSAVLFIAVCLVNAPVERLGKWLRGCSFRRSFFPRHCSGSSTG